MSISIRNGDPVFGKLSEANPDIMQFSGKAIFKTFYQKVGKKTLPQEIGNIALIRYPWELVRDNAAKIVQDYSSQEFSSHNLGSNSHDVEIRGNTFAIAESAEVERFVTFDSRAGPIIVEEEAIVESFTRVTGPCYIGKKAKIRSARIREGTTIGERCKVAGEVDCSIISEYSNKSHDGFLGHSFVGSWVNLGAMTTCSDLKNTYGRISVKLAGNPSILAR